MLDHKAKSGGMTVVRVSERDTSKTCSVCGTENETQRVERGLYDCEWGAVANAGMNGVENIRKKVLQSLATDGGRDRGNSLVGTASGLPVRHVHGARSPEGPGSLQAVISTVGIPRLHSWEDVKSGRRTGRQTADGLASRDTDRDWA